MKFSCDRCGKKYATAETPAPGRVYKLKCKACGHLIVVRTPAAGGTAATPPPASTPPPSIPESPRPEVELEIEAPPPAVPDTLSGLPALTPVPTRASDPTAEISMLTQLEEPRPPTPPPPPPPADTGYVDIFADSAPPAPPPAPVTDDPFLKAAQGAPAGGMVDPFADMREELGEKAPEPAHDAAPVREPPPPSAFAPPPRPEEDKKKGGLPLALIGIGFAAVLGIVVMVALQTGKKPAAPSAPPPAPVAAPTPPPAPPPPAPPPAPEPKKAEPAKAEPEPRPREEKKRVAKAEPRPEPKPKPEPRKPEPKPEPKKPEPKPVARAEPEKPVALPDAASALSPEAVQKVVNASRRAFENCIDQAAKKGTDTKFDGRKVALRLNVNPNGFVTYPTLDDVTLNRTDLGECLKSAARLMVFPKFQGDVFHVEVPLTLRGG